MKSEKILLTGGSGFIGGQVKLELLNKGYTKITELHYLDLQVYPKYHFDIIINCSSPNYSLIKFLISMESQYFIHISSARVYNSLSNPINELSPMNNVPIKKLFSKYFFSKYDYADKKVICDQLIQKLPNHHLARPSIVMGPRDTSARWKKLLTFRNCNSVDIPYLENSLNIVDNRDVAEGIVDSILSSGNRITNITGELISWEQFWSKIADILNFNINWVNPTIESKNFPYYNYFDWPRLSSIYFKNRIGFEKTISDAATFANKK